MEKVYICNNIKSEILSVTKFLNIKPYNLPGSMFLTELGYSEIMQYETLVNRLQIIADEYHINKQVLHGSILADFTVNQCIRLLIN